MRYVILPQGLRRMVPATVSQLITLNKDTTLVSIIAIQEVVRSGRVLSQTAGNPFVGGGDVQAPILQVMLFVGLLFVITNYAPVAPLAAPRGAGIAADRDGARPSRSAGVEDLAIPVTR